MSGPFWGTECASPEYLSHLLTQLCKHKVCRIQLKVCLSGASVMLLHLACVYALDHHSTRHSLPSFN